jgi:hypothetical protein
MDTKPKVDLQGIAKQVASFLPGWTWRGPLYEHTEDTHAVIRNAEGAEVTISGNGWARDGRFHISAGNWPKSKKGDEFSPYRHGGGGDESPRISVAATRSTKDIAREIERRFLPAYLPLYAKMVERRDATDVRQASAKTKCEELAKIVNGETRGLEAGDGEVHWYHEEATYGDAKSHDGGNEWNLNIRNLPFEKVAKILKIMKE